MKRCFSFFLSVILMFSVFGYDAIAADPEEFKPYVVDFVLETEAEESENDTRASGLINMYSLGLSKTGNTLNISGSTRCSVDVVKCGFKNLVIQRRKTSADSWKEYYDYGNAYTESTVASLSTTLVVESGYQYRISCKHYAKKSLLVTQSISNTSNIVVVS